MFFSLGSFFKISPADPNDLLLDMQSPAEGLDPGNPTPAQLLALLLPSQSQTQLLLQRLEFHTQICLRVGIRSETGAELSAELLEPGCLLSNDLTQLSRRLLQGETALVFHSDTGRLSPLGCSAPPECTDPWS